jgi:hypothetical protein
MMPSAQLSEDRLRRVYEAAHEVAADLCALAEEQPGNPHDELSTWLYEVARKIELADEQR